MDYDATMRYGANQYVDVLEALAAAGLPASFVQTGGMCGALEVRLEGGRTLLITDVEDTLAWEREHHQGWGVGLYSSEDHDDLALAYRQTEANDIEALLTTVADVLRA